jgi:formylglycine-generating enzyme required for sulfatase activity
VYRLKAGGRVETKKMLLLDGGGSVPARSSLVSGKQRVAEKAVAETYTVTITHGSFIPFEKKGVTIAEGQTMDFVITLIGETKIISGITLVAIPAGTFVMGQSSYAEPVHSVTVSSFEISMFEITQAQYRSVIAMNPSKFQSGDDYPVEQVSWFEAVNFCNRLSDAAGLERCYPDFPPIFDVVKKSAEMTADSTFCDFSKNGFRLPTEAEWEYACRAGTETRYYIGDNETSLHDAAWYGSDKTYPVGGKVKNAWGLYDMHGNVSEWCNDRYGNYSADSQTNPAGPLTGALRVIRGGSWNSIGISCQSGYRGAHEPIYEAASIGFRVVRRPEKN